MGEEVRIAHFPVHNRLPLPFLRLQDPVEFMGADSDVGKNQNFQNKEEEKELAFQLWPVPNNIDDQIHQREGEQPRSRGGDSAGRSGHQQNQQGKQKDEEGLGVCLSASKKGPDKNEADTGINDDRE